MFGENSGGVHFEMLRWRGEGPGGYWLLVFTQNQGITCENPGVEDLEGGREALP